MSKCIILWANISRYQHWKKVLLAAKNRFATKPDIRFEEVVISCELFRRQVE